MPAFLRSLSRLRKLNQFRRNRASKRRQLRIELVEQRRLLAVDVSLSGGILSVTDGASSTDDLTFSTSGADLVVTSNNANVITLTPPTIGTGSGLSLIHI